MEFRFRYSRQCDGNHMSRLKETDFQGVPGWQWDDGPIFVGKDSRKYAVGYGRVVQYLEEWKGYARLSQERALAEKRLRELKKIATFDKR